MGAKITVEGSANSYDLDDIHDSVVEIGGKYYFRHDSERVIRLTTPENKKKYFRVNSPLVVALSDGTRKLKSMCIRTEDGVWLDKTSDDLITVDGKFYRKNYTVEVDKKTYVITDPRLVKCLVSGAYILKETAIALDPWLYPTKKDDPYLVKPSLAVEICDEFTKNKPIWILKANKRRVFSPKRGEFIETHRDFIRELGPVGQIVTGFIDKTNPQEDRLENSEVLSKEYTPENGAVVCQLIPGILHVNTHTKFLPILEEARDKYIMPRIEAKLEPIRKKLNDNFDDLDERENVAKTFSLVPRPYAGKQRLASSSQYGDIILSNDFTATGGIQYSYGVELETSNGLMTDQKIVEDLRLNVVGDRSIGAGEYVTTPLLGTEGIKNIEKICRILNQTTLVDNRCGFHVHVGGYDPYPTPSFTRTSFINAIKLGAYIEHELYSALPPSRKPTLYHCHSIKRYEDIDTKNYNEYMGAYIFGPKEWWLTPTHNCPESMWPFKPYTLGPGRNSSSRLQQWQDGRYKWLNLANAFSDQSPHKTIELRIFPGTTVFEKVYAAVLLSLAFVWVLDNAAAIIRPGVTLHDIFDAAFGRKYPELVKLCDDFYEKRKQKFKRTRIYPSVTLTH